MYKKIIIIIITLSVMLLFPIEQAQGGRGGGGGGGRGGMAGGGRGATGGFTGFGTTAGGTTSIVGTEEANVTIIPIQERNWIIVRAPAEYMEQIAKWIDEFDNVEGIEETTYDYVTVRYVDVEELADTLMIMMEDMSTFNEIVRNISIQPLPTTRQLLIYGKEDYREMVKKLISEIDLPSNQLQRRTFKLKYADPEDIKEKIDELFSLTSSTGTSTRTTSTYSRTAYGTTGSGSLSADTVLVTTYPSLREVVILASEENMKEIETQITAWDSPIAWEELKPRIISVQNIDTVQLVDLLTSLFSSSATGGTTNTNTRQLLNTTGGTAAELGEKIIGPLYGKLSFVDIPDTKKIIVASSIAEAYQVIEDFIDEIDKADPAIVPKIVQLKYADPEDLSRRLNTVFAESGTSASIELSVTGLSSSSSMEGSTTSTTSQQETYTPPWAGSGGAADDEMPVSNILGKVRFMPEPNTKSILLLAPEQYIDVLEELIYDLDAYGKQVMIETVIVEVEHNKLTSLGFEFSSSGTALSSIGRFGISTEAVFGNPTDYLDYDTGLQRSDDFFLSGFGVTALIDFLNKKANANILNQQTIWTKDNEEANFFKGKQIPFVTGTTETTTSTGSVVASDTFDFQLVGMEVRVRPRITPENNVSMIINVNYSQQTGDKGLGNMDILSQMNSTTNMIIQNGDTLILGGILFQKDSTITYKIPGIGDIPILGRLFRHDSLNKENTELLVFIKPYVIDTAPETLEELLPRTLEAINNSQSRLQEIRSQLNTSMEEVNKGD